MTGININFMPQGLPPLPEIFIVGGTVRDLILGKAPSDCDIVTLGDPKALAQRLAGQFHTRAIELGKPGMRLFKVVTPGLAFDIVGANGDSIESDIQKRDFTVNAMAISAYDGVLIDRFDGTGDIKKRKIRMVSRENLISDPIRLLRAYRLGASLNFAIDGKTQLAITASAHLIKSAAGERIHEEWIKLLGAEKSFPYIKDMADIGLLTGIFPEMNQLKECLQNQYHQDDVFVHSLNAYGCLEDILNHPESIILSDNEAKKFLPESPKNPLLKHAMLLHDLGKPRTRSIDADGRVHFFNHEQAGADLVGIISKRLRFSNKDRFYIDRIVCNHMAPLLLFIEDRKGSLTSRAVNRFFKKTEGITTDLFICSAADMKAKGNHPDADEFVKFLAKLMDSYRTRYLPLSIQPPLITGDDLIKEFNLSPSPLLGRILKHIEEKRVEHLIHTRKEALDAVKIFLQYF